MFPLLCNCTDDGMIGLFVIIFLDVCQYVPNQAQNTLLTTLQTTIENTLFLIHSVNEVEKV